MAYPPIASSSTLATATRASTEEWRMHLHDLFEQAQERFPDVVWELGDEDIDDAEEVWGHKAIVYARAPPSFQARYFKFRPAPSPNPYGASPIPGAQSTYSLTLPLEDMTPGSRSPSPFAARRVMSPVPSTISGQVLRLRTNIAPGLFTQELEYLYTGRAFSDAFEFLFDAGEKRPDDDGDDDDARITKLRNDLIYMWRSRLYSDVKVVLTGNFPSGRDSMVGNELSTAAFSSHKFMLVSRSNYFRQRLQSTSFNIPSDDTEIKLPSPPFTPASVHFTLGFIYTGTLNFSHRTFDLTTAFHIFRSALYLQLSTLYDEMQARLVEEMMHGLFHAFLPFDQYEKITAGRWGVGGCKCKQCQRRAPRVLEFAMSSDVNDQILTRGAQRALSGMFGEGWCSPEFAGLPAKTRSNLVKGVSLRTNSVNVIPLLFAAQSALSKLEINAELWVEEVREMIHTVRKRIDDTMCTNCEEVFEQEEWLTLLERDGAEFGDNEKIGWAMDSIRRGLSDKTAPLVYQNLVSAILIRPDATTGSTLLPPTSIVRATVEQARKDVLKWIARKNRWQLIQAAGGFENLEPWAIKEISDEIDIPVDVLLGDAKPGNANLRPVGDGETASITSFHSATSGRPPRKEPTPSVHSISRVSVNSTASRLNSRRPIGPSSPPPAPSAMSRNQNPARLRPILSSRVQSTASQPSGVPTIRDSTVPRDSIAPRDSVASEALTSYTSSTPNGSPKNPAPALPPMPPVPDTQTVVSPPVRPKSIAASVTSVRSTTSTIRKSNGGLTVPAPTNGRPASSTSMRSNTSTSFNTAQETLTPPIVTPRPSSVKSPSPEPTTRPRRVSTASNASAVSAKSTATNGRPRKSSGDKPVPSAPQALRPRRSSNASATSTTSSRAPKTSSKTATRSMPPSPARPATESGKGSKIVNRAPSGSTTATRTPLRKPASNASIRSTASSVAGGRRKVSTTPEDTLRKSVAEAAYENDFPDLAGLENLVHPKETPSSPPPLVPSPIRPVSSLPAEAKGKGKERTSFASEVSKIDLNSRPASIAPPRSEGGSTARHSRADTMTPTEAQRRNSTDTITESTVTGGTVRAPKRLPPTPRARHGITLKVGIPCVVVSKRNRYRAFARYIGELEGEQGPWVGVEVPVGESWGSEKLAGRQWNDGSINGTRYFQIASNHQEYDDGEQRAARRRRIDMILSERPGLGRKREGDQLPIDRDRMKRMRSVSPAFSDASISAEVRGLFVRPQQVIYVVDAEQ